MKPTIQEGTWFALPLQQGGYSVGVVARKQRRGGILLAYFFGRRWDAPPSLDDVRTEPPNTAIRVLRVGDLGLRNGRWHVIGFDPMWRREDWPIPRLMRQNILTGERLIVEYADDDPGQEIREFPTSDVDVQSANLYGFVAAEVVLSRAIDGISS